MFKYLLSLLSVTTLFFPAVALFAAEEPAEAFSRRLFKAVDRNGNNSLDDAELLDAKHALTLPEQRFFPDARTVPGGDATMKRLVGLVTEGEPDTNLDSVTSLDELHKFIVALREKRDLVLFSAGDAVAAERLAASERLKLLLDRERAEREKTPKWLLDRREKARLANHERRERERLADLQRRNEQLKNQLAKERLEDKREQDAREKAERERRERLEREAKEKLAKANADKAAKDKAEREARERLAKTNADKAAKEKAEREAKEKLAKANAEKAAKDKAEKELKEKQARDAAARQKNEADKKKAEDQKRAADKKRDDDKKKADDKRKADDKKNNDKKRDDDKKSPPRAGNSKGGPPGKK